MKLSRFVGATSREVLRQVREALGRDALIVSNRSVPEGVEVLATLDEPVATSAAAPHTGTSAYAPKQIDSATGLAGANTIAGLESAIGALRGAMESRLDGLLWGGSNGPGREPLRATLYRGLLDSGFSARLARAMLERLPGGLDLSQARAWARNELVTHLPVLADDAALFSRGGVYALVGPTGAGKTTTVAKLAARCVARVGRDQVAMLTTDNFRIGALEQLQIYGRLLGVPTLSVRDLAELRSALDELGDRKIILIDTTGISQRDRNVAAQAALLCGAGRSVQRLLVVNAASQGDTLDEVAHAYRKGAGVDVAGCIVTKLDEASRLGPALDTAIRHRLPIHYICVGQKVPEDLELARADALVDQALGAPERMPALCAPNEADMATLLGVCATEARSEDQAQRRLWLATALLPNWQSGPQVLAEAASWAARDIACARARSAWRDLLAAGEAPSYRATIATDLVPIQQGFTASCDRRMLALHGTAVLRAPTLAGARLQATVMLSDRGQALGAALPEVCWPDPGGALANPSSGRGHDGAPEGRAAALAAALHGVPLVHLLDTDARTSWRQMPAGAQWVARQVGTLKVLHDDCPTILNAVGKSLGYLRVGHWLAPAGVAALHQASSPDVTPVLWASGTEVWVPQRGGSASSVRLVCARLTAADGTVLRQFFGLTNLSAGEADAATIARWLVRQDQARRAFRDMAQAWSILPDVDQPPDLSAQTRLAAQLGAACWQAAHASGAAVLAPLMACAMKQGRKLNARAAPEALLRVFAMLEAAA